MLNENYIIYIFFVLLTHKCTLFKIHFFWDWYSFLLCIDCVNVLFKTCNTRRNAVTFLNCLKVLHQIKFFSQQNVAFSGFLIHICRSVFEIKSQEFLAPLKLKVSSHNLNAALPHLQTWATSHPTTL